MLSLRDNKLDINVVPDKPGNGSGSSYNDAGNRYSVTQSFYIVSSKLELQRAQCMLSPN